MFTGIIETTGTLISKRQKGRVVRFRFGVCGIEDGMQKGDSIAVNGVCLTVAGFGHDFLEMDAVLATMKATALGEIRRGGRVNFERALKVSSRLGGHWVQGHVDGVGSVKKIVKRGRNIDLEIEASRELIQQLVNKGSVALDGISLTIQRLDHDQQSFVVTMIPHTWKHTNMSSVRQGSKLNIEIDILSKYVRHHLENLHLSPCSSPAKQL
ncbi:MAG: riboflavin synthase [Candidatus Omnitrophica bacterium]|nr:riboflavin synthase [Candidatus Omnitrophota bacterium]